MNLFDGTFGHFYWGDLNKFEVSWTWPTDLAFYPQVALGLTAITIGAAKANQAVPLAKSALGLADTAEQAKTGAKMAEQGMSAMKKQNDDDEEPKAEKANSPLENRGDAVDHGGTVEAELRVLSVEVAAGS